MKLSTMLINGALSICAAATFVGCGSSSGTTTATGTKVGYFVDAPVEGLTYSCGGRTGTTGSDGGFRYNDGETCTFTVGGITVGSVAVPSDGIVTPQDIAGVSRSDTSNGTVTKIAQFLQSLSDSSGNIKISAETAQKLANTSGSVASIDVATVASTVGKTVVDMGVAQSRLASYMNTLAASNPSFLTSGAANTPATTTTTTTTSSSDTTSTPVTYTVPVISSFPATITPTAQVASFTAQSDVSATGYWVVLPAADAAPTAAQILAGKDSTNSAVTLSGSATMSGGTAKLFSITGLAYATDYKVYFAAKNAGDATKVTAVSTATMSTAALADVTPTLSSLSAVGNAYNSATFSIKSDVGATGYWIAVPKATTMTGLTAAQVIAGKDKDGNDVTLKGNVAMTGGATTEVTVTSLAVNTEYDIYFAVKNSAAATKTTLYGSPIQANTTVAPTISATSVTGHNPVAGTATLNFTTTIGIDYWYVIQPSTNTNAPSVDQVLAGQDSTGAAVATGMKGTDTHVSAGIVNGGGSPACNLSSNDLRQYAAFDVYLVAKNHGDLTKVSSVTKISFSSASTTSGIGTGTAGETDGAVASAQFVAPGAIVRIGTDFIVFDADNGVASDGLSYHVRNIASGSSDAVTTLTDGIQKYGMAYLGSALKQMAGGATPDGTSYKVYIQDLTNWNTNADDLTTVGGASGPFAALTFSANDVKYMASSGDGKLYMMNGTNLLEIDLTSGSGALATTNISDASNLNGKTVQGIAVNATHVYISTSGGRILKYLRGNLSTAPTVLSVGDHVTGMALDGDGNLFYLAVDHGRTNLIFVPAGGNGSILGTVATNILPSDASKATDGSVEGGGKYIAIDSTGKKFYVTDTTGNKVVKVTIP